MNRRTNIIVIAMIILAVALLVWLIFRGIQKTNTPNKVMNSDTPPAVNAPAQEVPLRTIPVQDSTSGSGEATVGAGVEQLARAFVERYGSYSQESNFENMVSLYPFMTTAMQRATAILIARDRAAKSASAPDAPRAITTRALTVQVRDKSADHATVAINTQRMALLNSGGPLKVYYQAMEVVLQKVEGEWKVDKAAWK